MKHLFLILLFLAGAAHAQTVDKTTRAKVAGSGGEPFAGALPHDIVNASGVVNPAAYKAIGNAYSSPAAITYRFGEPPTRTDVQTFPLRADIGQISHCGGSCKIAYQLGKESTAMSNNYVSTHGAAIGVPLAGSSVSDSVAWFQASAVDRNTWMQRPQILWQAGKLLPSAMDGYYRDGVLSPNEAADLPIVADRCANAADSSCRVSIIGTQGSATKGATLFTIGNTTASNRASVQFPIGLVPTGISSTAGGELAVVSLWDTVNVKGKVAIVSLGATCEGCTLKGPRYDWWHGFIDSVHVGFWDQGNFIFMKIVGYVDLPDTMKAPTGIKVTTGMTPFDAVVHPAGKEVSSIGLLASPLAQNRSKFLPGGEFHATYAKGGVAVVISKSEKKAAFIDLGPYLRFTNGMFLNSDESNAKTRNIGMGPDQWPYPIAAHPQSAPVLVKIVNLDAKPTGVATTVRSYWNKDDRERVPGTPYWRATPRQPSAWIATQDGTLRIYSLGRYAAGPKPTTPDPADIAEVGRVTGLGAGVTGLSESKGLDQRPDALNTAVLFYRRAERQWGWVGFRNDGTGSVIRRMADSRVDPVAVVELDQYSTNGCMVAVADYSGASIKQYRCGIVRYSLPSSQTDFCPSDGPGCPTLTPNGEYAGSLSLPFRPFAVHSSNAP